MKKEIIKFLLAGFIMLVVFSSCKEDDPAYPDPDPAKLKLSETSFTVLDSELETTIDFITTAKTVTNVAILLEGVELYPAQASGNKAVFTLKRTDLGLDKIGDEVRIYINATVDGVVKEMYANIDMVSASSIEEPETGIYELSSVVKNFTYEVEPMNSATVVNVEAFSKVGINATYTSMWSKAYDADDLDIGFVGTDYTKDDTLFVQLIATSGTFADTVSSSAVIMGYELGGMSSLTLDTMYLNQSKGYDLVGDSIVDDTETVLLIEFTHNVAARDQGIMVSNSTVLLKIDNVAKFEDEMNVTVLKDTIDTSGGTVVAVPDLSVGDMFVIKHTRTPDTYYGLIKITAINTTINENDDFVIFDYVMEKYDVEN